MYIDVVGGGTLPASVQFSGQYNVMYRTAVSRLSVAIG